MDDLKKSIDELVDDIFKAERSIIAKPSDTADEAIKEAPKAQKDEARNAGRPEQISDVPQTDKDGKREGKYDDDITENDDKEVQPEETKQNKIPEQMKKSISLEEYAEYEAFKKQKTEEQERINTENLAKAQKEALTSIVEDLKKSFTAENDALRKSLEEMKKANDEQSAIIKAMAKRPIQSKSVTGIGQLNKSFEEGESNEPKQFTKSDIVNAAMELRKSNKLTDNEVVELDTFGSAANPRIRSMVENYLKNK